MKDKIAREAIKKLGDKLGVDVDIYHNGASVYKNYNVFDYDKFHKELNTVKTAINRNTEKIRVLEEFLNVEYIPEGKTKPRYESKGA